MASFWQWKLNSVCFNFLTKRTAGYMVYLDIFMSWNFQTQSWLGSNESYLSLVPPIVKIKCKNQLNQVWSRLIPFPQKKKFLEIQFFSFFNEYNTYITKKNLQYILDFYSQNIQFTIIATLIITERCLDFLTSKKYTLKLM